MKGKRTLKDQLEKKYVGKRVEMKENKNGRN